MKPIKNIFMCLVHENQDCIVDLVRNLKYLDSTSIILLYNGGTNKDLFKHFPFEKYGVIIHPNPKPLQWGWLHDFAIDCMEYAINNLEFDTITVVDSDQLACGRNYTAFITETFRRNSNLGMLGLVPSRILSDTKIDPAITAYQEKELWQPFLDQLPNGKEAFLHWTFWPSTVFTYKAAVGLVDLFRTNVQLQKILTKTKIWASEEIILPTLTIALGFSIIKNPCTYDLVKYKEVYTKESIQKAIDDKKSFWIHPVLRNIKDRNRAYIRTYYKNYVFSHPKEFSEEIFQLMKNIYPKINHIEGWLDNDEFELLVELTFQKATNKKNAVFVEIGSYCGKATSVIALVTKHVNNQSKIIAIDDFTGRLGAEDTTIDKYPPSYDKMKFTLNNLQLLEEVNMIKQTPFLVCLEEKIDFILLDGLHDYTNVARDFYHFEKNFKEDTLILFHDYCLDFPGVISFVKELINDNAYQIVKYSSSLIALQKRTATVCDDNQTNVKNHINLKTIKEEFPLVSCIMPTYNRSEFIKYAIHQFLEQNYPNKELIILDDSEKTIASLIPDNFQIKYVYLQEKLDIGSKRNKACEMSKGEFIIHLDDDDFYASDWIEKQLSFLINNELEITGLSTPLFYDKSTSTCWQYNYPASNKPWVYGATLCYTKKIWESNPFPVMNCGEDNAFVWAKCVKKILPNNTVKAYIGQIHRKNTSPKQINNDRWSKLEKEDISRILTNHSIKSIPIFSNFENKNKD
ncbi:glycosyltransferase [Aquimarina muelleri]|nr:glycosyltransferase [Aquimarina muelleri]MCX2763691.1 glycosyltransferase [Aquimarina muelleri]